MNYKVYEVEDKVTPNGKALKKLVLQGEGKQYPDKNVTMWADHPLFEDTVAGMTIDVELDVKDSTTPNPHGGFYKNKTVIGERRAQPTPPQEKPAPTENKFAVSNEEIKNILLLKIEPQLTAIWGRLGLLLKNSTQITPDDLPLEEPKF